MGSGDSGANSRKGSGGFRGRKLMRSKGFWCRWLMRFQEVPGQMARILPRSSKLLGITHEFIFSRSAFSITCRVSLFGSAIFCHVFLFPRGKGKQLDKRSTQSSRRASVFSYLSALAEGHAALAELFLVILGFVMVAPWDQHGIGMGHV